MLSADGLRDGDAERCETVEDSDANLELGGLTVEVAGNEFLAEQLHAVHLGLDAAPPMVAGPFSPERPAEALDGAQRFVPRSLARAVFPPRLSIAARWDDRVGATDGDGVATGAVIIGAARGHRGNRFTLRDLRQQAGHYGRVTDATLGDLDRANLQRRFINREVNLAPNTSPGPAMLAGIPFAFASNLDARAVYERVQRPARVPVG